mmetsp:Transcript_37053/g.77006  ORF Transcript_37053/g.77006 Transcript_37053/m.77006 type:complete len:402 (-) Transcript_37053:423-1628(-)
MYQHNTTYKKGTSLVHQGVIEIEDGFQETHHHKSGVGDFLSKWKFINVDTKLVGKGEVGVSTGDNTVIINHNNLFVGDLSLGILQNSISINVPRIVDTVVVQDALLVGHDHVFIHVQEIDNAKFVGGHNGSGEELSRRESVAFNDGDQSVGSWNGRDIGNIPGIQFEWVVSKEICEGRWVLGAAVTWVNSVNTDTWFVTKSGITRSLLKEGRNASISQDRESLVSTRRVMLAVHGIINNFRVDSKTFILLQGFNGTMDLVSTSGKVLPVEGAVFINVRSTDKRGKNDTSGRVDGKDGRHQLVTNNGKILVDHSKTFNVKIASSQDAKILEGIPSRIRNIVGNLNISAVLPLNQTIGIMDEGSSKILGRSVGIVGTFSMSVSEWLLNLHVNNVESVVSTVGR